MAVTVQQFIERLTDSGLMSAAEVSSFQDSLPPDQRPRDVQALVTVLYRAGKITKYQAKAVYEGKTKGLVFGEYTVLDQIGEGGMGVVLKAQHRRMKRHAAIKILSSSGMKMAGAVERFHREVEAAAKLSHTNIVTAYDAGQHQGVHYLAMEYVEGKDLASIVKERGPLGIQEAVDCILQAARGLEYAHGQGIVHRDIKPGNLLLDRKGTVKILDMGLARMAGADAALGGPERLTATGQVMGTCDYMAPEQAFDSHNVDHRADIYSLGCTLYRLLTGQPPYARQSLMQILVAHREDPIPSICEARPEVPAALDAVFQKMVAKQPDDRQQSMAEVVAELEAILGVSSGRPAARASEEPSSAALAMSLAFLQEDAPRGTLTREKKPTVAERTGPHAIIPTGDGRRTTDGKASVRRPSSVALQSLASVVRRPSSVALAAGGLVLLLGIILASTMRHGTPESKIGDLKSEIRNPKSEIAPLAVAPFDEKKAKEHQEGWSKHLGVPVEMTNSIGMKLVLIPPGEFMMGSPKELIEDELKTHGDEPWYKDHLPGEGPRHRVRITRPFYLGMYEVTQGEYERVIGKNPSKFSATGKGKDKVAGQDTKRFPVEQVSWEEAAEFCRKLSDLPEEKAAGRTYRLPSEAQWEYACRAGTAGRYSFSLGRSGLSREHEEKALSDYGWFGSNAGDMPHAVGERKPNAWGLYDMHGNVWELCHDWYDRDYYAISPLDDPGGPPAGSCRVDRGGSWTDPAWHCRSACRDLYLPELGHDNLGFRASLVLPDTVAERAKMGPSNDAAQPPGGSTANKPSPAPPAPNPQSPIPPPAVGGLVGADGKWQLPPGAPFPAVAPFDAAKAKEHQEGWAKHLRVPVEITNSIGMKLVLIPPGEFQMGSPKELIEEEMRLYGGDGWYRDLLPGEGPQHRVRITRPYWLGVTAVTQEEYQRVMGSNPSKFPGDPKRPVEQVSWGEAVEFCRRLSELPGEKAAKQRYGLPTEAQWEYACRAGSTGRWCFSTQRNPLPRVVEGEILGEYGWFNANTDVPTHPVAQKQANAWGLHDMYGNVWEWCEDWYDRDFYAKSAIDDPTGASGGARRVLRGGGWRYPAGICRSASRDCFEPGNRDGHLGFRAALVLADK